MTSRSRSLLRRAAPLSSGAAALALCATPLCAQSLFRASVSTFGAQGNGASTYPAISANGGVAAFESFATNLVAGDTNALGDVFARDLVNGVTQRVSVTNAGNPANGASVLPALSFDGRFVAFESAATNLVAGDTNGVSDVFVRDRMSNTTERVSVTSAGVQGTGGSHWPAISGDGRYVAFASDASDLVAGDTNGVSDIFLRDRTSGTTVRVSLAAGGVEVHGGSFSPTLTPDGAFVAFESDAADLVTGDTNGVGDVFRVERATGAVVRVSVSSGGVQADASCRKPSMSADGSIVAFYGAASTLVAGDTNGLSDAFVRDVGAGTTTRISRASDGALGSLGSFEPMVTSNGRWVTFSSLAPELVLSDTNSTFDVLVHDRASGDTHRMSVSESGAESDGSSAHAMLTDDAHALVFVSVGENLVPGDTNLQGDVFVRVLAPPIGIELCAGDGSLATACPCAPPNTVPSPSAAPGFGCANSFRPSGAQLYADGFTTPDFVTFSAEIAPSYVGFAFLVKGNAQDTFGIANGDGVRCVSGQLIRFGAHNAGTNGALPGYWSYPNTAQTTAVHTATAQPAGQTAYYQLIYRNLTPGFCSDGTTNWSNGLRVDW